MYTNVELKSTITSPDTSVVAKKRCTSKRNEALASERSIFSKPPIITFFCVAVNVHVVAENYTQILTRTRIRTHSTHAHNTHTACTHVHGTTTVTLAVHHTTGLQYFVCVCVCVCVCVRSNLPPYTLESQRETYSSLFVCVCVCVRSNLSPHTLELQKRHQRIHRNTGIILNFADFAKNASFKSYGVISTPPAAPVS